jgi:hypothetical protein
MVFPFHTTVNASMSSGLASFLLSPNSTVSPRGLIEADTWAYFRVKSFEFRLHPTSDVLQACGFIGVVADTLPSSISQISELLASVMKGSNSTVPTEWCRVRNSELSGAFPWYKTIPGTADPTEEAPGYMVLAGGTTGIYTLEMRGVFEFKDAVASGNTPAAVAMRQRIHQERVQLALDKERALLLKVLAQPPAVPSNQVPVGPIPNATK